MNCLVPNLLVWEDAGQVKSYDTDLYLKKYVANWCSHEQARDFIKNVVTKKIYGLQSIPICLEDPIMLHAFNSDRIGERYAMLFSFLFLLYFMRSILGLLFFSNSWMHMKDEQMNVLNSFIVINKFLFIFPKVISAYLTLQIRP